MTRIKVGKNSISIKGHAGYAESGRDIVCAAVSVLSATLAQCLLKQKAAEPSDIVLNKGDAFFKWRGEPSCIETVLTGFELLAENYPENVKIFEDF